jgi:DnaJ-class molecular chaperone
LIFKPLRQFGIAPDFDPNKDYYKTLGVPPSATEKDIKEAFYKLAKEYHPDKTGGKTAERFKEISNAYQVIGNKEKK